MSPPSEGSHDRQTEVTLRDGRSIRVRPIRHDDGERVQGLFQRMSPHSRYLRFFHSGKSLSPAEVEAMTMATPPQSCTFAATTGEGEEERIVATGRWELLADRESAQIGFMVDDGIQLGGVHAEQLKDVAFALHSLTGADPQRMLARRRGLPLLQGWRGSPRRDVEVLKAVLLRLSLLIVDLDEIEQLEINPLIGRDEDKGCVAVDVRVLVRPA